MNSLFRTFLKKIIIFTAIIIGILSIFYYYLPKAYIHPALPFILIFYFTITLVTHYFQLKIKEKKFASFTSNFMIITFLKLLILLTVLLIYVFLNQNNALSFIIWYFIFYILYTVFEVIELQKIKQ